MAGDSVVGLLQGLPLLACGIYLMDDRMNVHDDDGGGGGDERTG